MIHHEIDVQGKIFVQKVTTLPSWTADDERRIILVDANNTFYYGTDAGWVADHKFTKLIIAGQSDVVADETNDELTLVEGNYVLVTTNAATDTITFTVDASNGADKIPISNGTKNINLNADLLDGYHASDIITQAGTKMWFWQATAPTDWTIIDNTSDCLLAIKGSSGTYNITPGSGTAGTWTQPGHIHTGPSHTHTGSNHYHTIHTIPSNYTLTPTVGTQYPIGVDTGGILRQSTGGTSSIQVVMNYTNPSGTGPTGSGGTGGTSSAATATSYRPQARVGILAQKD